MKAIFDDPGRNYLMAYIDDVARLAVLEAVSAVLSDTEHKATILGKLAEARHDLDSYTKTDADEAWRRALSAVNEMLERPAIEQSSTSDDENDDCGALSPRAAARLLYEARRHGGR
jgi:hypothetical protein